MTIDLSLTTQHGGDAEGDTFDGIEAVHGSERDDSLTGDYRFNILIGGGMDFLVSQDGKGVGLRRSFRPFPLTGCVAAFNSAHPKILPVDFRNCAHATRMN